MPSGIPGSEFAFSLQEAEEWLAKADHERQRHRGQAGDRQQLRRGCEVVSRLCASGRLHAIQCDLIELRKAPRQLAQRLMSEFDTQRLIHAAEGRDRLMLEVAYYGALRVSELVPLTWGQLIPRESGELQIEIVGKGQKARQVLLPAELAERLLATRAGAAAADHVFRSQRAEALTERGLTTS